MIAVALVSPWWPARALAVDPEDRRSPAPPPTRSLSPAEAALVLAVARTLFPHDMLPDRHYWAAVLGVDAAAVDEATAAGIRAGLQALGSGFASRAEPAREAALATIEKTPFFALLYSQTLNALYLNPEVWAIFGYQGSSVEQGGYLHRGFDEIDWLPEEEGAP